MPHRESLRLFIWLYKERLVQRLSSLHSCRATTTVLAAQLRVTTSSNVQQPCSAARYKCPRESLALLAELHPRTLVFNTALAASCSARRGSARLHWGGGSSSVGIRVFLAQGKQQKPGHSQAENGFRQLSLDMGVHVSMQRIGFHTAPSCLTIASPRMQCIICPWELADPCMTCLECVQYCDADIAFACGLEAP